MKTPTHKLKNQEGITVLGTVIAIAIAAVVLIGIFHRQLFDKKQTQAQALGNQVAMVINAYASRMASDPHFGVGAYKGVSALLTTHCGGDSLKAYLPCGFHLNHTLIKKPLIMRITTGAQGTNTLNGALSIGPVGADLNAKFTATPYLAGAVLQSAQTHDTVTVSYALDHKTSVITANMIVTKGATPNSFLKLDGSNDMTGDITFSSHAHNHNIKNVAGIDESGSTVDLGNQSGTFGDSNVEVNDMRIRDEHNQLLSSLLQKQLKQTNCYTANPQWHWRYPGHPDYGYYTTSCANGFFVKEMVTSEEKGRGGGITYNSAICCKLALDN